MDSTKLTALLLISMLVISIANPVLDCGNCEKTSAHHKPAKIHPPKFVKPPITLPPLVKPAKGKPGKLCPSTPSSPSSTVCPIDVLKLGECVDVLGGLVHVGLGNPIADKCCPLIAGLVELEAAVCLCNALKLKLLNLNLYVPIALQLLITCGKPPPSGYTCSL
ncbi:hypothetical protein DCAR_0625450 [Daucus carota subsp. sativus]|uniref:Uncharacterized protein n=1 Tax=Daucus carota subsp. sativus TaxID=79200 RepID=A0A164WGD0_DAUCS|nr:PREDICTED: 36.4 kDa proline-rich protein-like [Daucus carota subsp. sativus]WOH06027.1 hypothetical protein DCAR_0625450 [Daucus carota subsp. sativus]